MTREKEIKLNARLRADQYDHPAKWSDTYYGFISGAEWADAHPHWISVEDELPTDGQLCIVLIDRKALQGTPRIRSAIYAPNVLLQNEGFWYNRMSKKHHITHWMPLPEAPSSSEFPNNHIIDANKKVDRVIGTADHIKTALDMLNKKGGEE